MYYLLFAVVLSAGIAIALFLALYFGHTRMIGRLQASESLRGFAASAEILAAVALSLVASFFSLAIPTTWSAPGPSIAAGAPLWTAILALYIAVRWLTTRAKDKDAARIRDLEAACSRAEAEGEAMARQRDFSTKVAAYVWEIVAAKLSRILESYSDSSTPVTMNRYLDAMAPDEQVQVIIRTIHGFFASQVDGAHESMRLGVYMRSEADPRVLVPTYQCNRKGTAGAFSERSAYMQVDVPGAAKSLIVQAFRSAENLIVISSCPEAERAGDFHYFSVEQREYLKSMLTFRHRWLFEGKEDALIVAIDTSQEHFFGRFNEEEIKSFLVEMMRRLEYEILGCKVHKALRSTLL